MLLNTLRVAALALLLVALACSERAPVTAPSGPDRVAPSSATSTAAGAERLARSMALALGDPAFRAHVKAQLDRSPFREHKLPFQRFLAADGGRGAAALARSSGFTPADVTREANRAVPLEMYLPVPEHRRAWTGGDDILVATAVKDHDPPVAFDVHGNRRLLDPDRGRGRAGGNGLHSGTGADLPPVLRWWGRRRGSAAAARTVHDQVPFCGRL